jgi:NTP pyrophosphatase (non-canonical NTP hydrolase)
MVKNMTADSDTTIQKLKELVSKFIHDREWEKFHNPKNLAEAICIEAAELLEGFQWFSADEALRQISDPSKLEHIKEELADVLVYCLSLANVTNIDVADAVVNKLKKNNAKYPVEKFRGRAHL